MDAYGEVGAGDPVKQTEEHCDQQLSGNGDDDDDDADLRLAFALMNTSTLQSLERNGDIPDSPMAVVDPYFQETPSPRKTSGNRSPLGGLNCRKDLAPWLDQTFLGDVFSFRKSLIYIIDITSNKWEQCPKPTSTSLRGQETLRLDTCHVCGRLWGIEL